MIYLDNCATTKPRREVIEIMMESLKNDFANPSSLHRLGMKAEKKVKEARDNISEFLNVSSGEIYFTSGGTESNNIAIQSAVNKLGKRGKHLITTKIEHPSVLNVMKYYEKNGFEVTYLNVNEFGIISLEELKNAIRKDTILVSLMHVNNEIGSVQPISQIKKLISSINPNTLFHVDGVQGFGKVSFSLKGSGIDFYSISAHKIHGPKGIGALYVDKKHTIAPIVFGGNQEKGLRSGTENLTGIIGFGEAVRLLNQEEIKHAQELKLYFNHRIQEIDYIKINSTLDEQSSPYVINVSFLNVRGEVLLHYLENKEIYISTSSACSSNGTEKSHVLKSIGLKNNEIEGTIRFCFSYEITKEQIDFTIEALKIAIEEIRQITMR